MIQLIYNPNYGKVFFNRNGALKRTRLHQNREVGDNMIFKGISRSFSLLNEDQYNTIGAFWDSMSEVYGVENLRGLGYSWHDGYIDYAIGLKSGEIADSDFFIELPDAGWETVEGKTESLKEIYDEIYKDGALTYEIEEFSENGNCKIQYYRTAHFDFGQRRKEKLL